MIKNLLLIDDDETTLELIKLTVIRNHFAENVITLKNGQEGVNYFHQLATSQEGVAPDLIFLDIFMPVMDGWEFLDEFSKKFQPQFPNTPICILTYSLEPEDQDKAQEYPGIIYAWNKPLFIEDLEKIKNHEQLKHHFV
ncbi:response regulator [Telluribacter humicola]|uniref:response regulator n=1 Tax=Telluribacter humicola TaxID=1720261 RepID=UPI001A95DCEE|nr:response regulator [Telluribacter humicola]